MNFFLKYIFGVFCSLTVFYPTHAQNCSKTLEALIYNPVATPDSTTNYQVSVLDNNGCISAATITVHVNKNNDFRLYQRIYTWF